MSTIYEEILGIKVNPRIYAQMWRCHYEVCKGGCCYKDTTEAYLLGGELLRKEHQLLKKLCKESITFKESLSYLPPEQYELIRSGKCCSSVRGRYFTSLLDDGRCCFVDMVNGKCSLKNEGSAVNIPVHCQLFPLIWEEEILDFSDERFFCEDSEVYGITTGTYVIEFCGDAICRMFGNDFFNALVNRAYERRIDMGLPTTSTPDTAIPVPF